MIIYRVLEKNKSIQKNVTKAADLLQIPTSTTGITTTKVMEPETTTNTIEDIPKPQYDIDEADYTSGNLPINYFVISHDTCTSYI